ncbi:hypothetical protein HanOQP8_Chr12g0432211 [Helianthus annuus]|nr:hypothetical protein HanIR_Chr12g0564821 [Helianthus annuus]KAJ0503962.1 hypothetical protein HanHA89_Chr12g0454121 [Helianthus annuus]KAJ0677005.1 hypothetical protein HanOQP8_Chr12g0432211 [Helianthus annuus]
MYTIPTQYYLIFILLHGIKILGFLTSHFLSHPLCHFNPFLHKPHCVTLFFLFFSHCTSLRTK